MNSGSLPVLTMDVDWAPDFVIDHVADILRSRSVKATWFVTHVSPAIERLRNEPGLFELGIHPNFLDGSSQGAGPEEVLEYCMGLVPNAVSVRTHGLVQSTGLLGLIADATPIQTDVSLYLPHSPAISIVEYYWGGRKLTRIPYVWEDDLELERPHPVWRWTELASTFPAIAIFDFHPIHIFLNTVDMGNYQRLKESAGSLTEVSRSMAEELIHSGSGPATLFSELVDYLAQGDNSATIAETASDSSLLALDKRSANFGI